MVWCLLSVIKEVRDYMEKEQSRKVALRKTIALVLFRILYWLVESWLFFCLILMFGYVDGIEEMLYSQNFIFFIILLVLMVYIEVRRVRKIWHKKDINRAEHIVISMVVVHLPLLGYFFVPFVLDSLTILRYGSLY